MSGRGINKIVSCLAFVSMALLGSVGLTACGGGDVAVEAPPPQMRFISELQYRNSIADILGEHIDVVGRFEQLPEVEHMAAVGSSEMSISSRSYERYYALAIVIAEQAASDENWSAIMPCDVPEGAAFDEPCIRTGLGELGERILRRDIAAEELDRWVAEVKASADALASTQDSVALLIEGLLASPDFLFIVDTIEAGPGASGVRLTGLAKAHRLSYFLWNSVPDDELLRVAESGELHDPKVLQAQVERMVASESLSTGAEAFFEDFLDLNRFETLDKDKLIYPAFNKLAALDAKEQLLKFLNFHLIANKAPYADIFTAKETFMTRPLGMLYHVPVEAREGWEAYAFAEDDPRAGLLSHVGFTALHSHPGRSSATLRGIAIRELLLCQPVAPAPAAVNFTVVQDTSNPEFRTARERLTQHRTDPSCKSCHEFIDPVGLALENFDGAGAFRDTENGAPIDTHGEIDAISFTTLPDMQKAIARHPAASACLVEKMQKYALGRKPYGAELAWRARLEKSFDRNAQSLPALMKSIALSPEFLSVGAPETETTQQQTHLIQAEGEEI